MRDGMLWSEFWDVLRTLGYKLEAMEGGQWLAAVREDLDT